jgi:hypothetical protein
MQNDKNGGRVRLKDIQNMLAKDFNIPIISQETSYRKIWLYDRGDYDKSKHFFN